MCSWIYSKKNSLTKEHLIQLLSIYNKVKIYNRKKDFSQRSRWTLNRELNGNTNRSSQNDLNPFHNIIVATYTKIYILLLTCFQGTTNEKKGNHAFEHCSLKWNPHPNLLELFFMSFLERILQFPNWLLIGMETCESYFVGLISIFFKGKLEIIQ